MVLGTRPLQAVSTSSTGHAPRTPRLAPYVWGAAVLYAVVLGGLAMAGIHVSLVKTLIAPWLVFLGIQLAGGQAFVRAWAVPFSAIILFDSSRGWIYAMILRWDLPVYGAYALSWERTLFRVALPETVQQAFRAGWLDSAAVIVHASHFAFFLVFGFVVWVQDRAAFRGWARGLYGVLGLGALTYLCVPTAPPWMAGLDLERITSSIYNARVPTLVAGLDTNPVAAMPSIHVAIPAYCALVGARLGGWRVGVPLWVYVAAVSLAAIYLGEHYAVDALAGIILAWFCAWFWSSDLSEESSPYWRAGVLTASAVGLSLWTIALIR